MTTFPEHWEVPQHIHTALQPASHRTALVIPVINEGDRIVRQLEAIQQAQPDVDIIIADGGSTDGSMEPKRLRTLGVTALITKTGPGKLSAQLRCAYAVALIEGYEGIITMDGNGKDGVEGIQKMVDRLAAGVDYVQGSRYAPGGSAINTPKERAFGNRVIHAPLLGWANGHTMTDTTNGFRGYSRRFLMDPKVAPFRNIFTRYELLFYLTVAAGKLGYTVEEVGVARGYPDHGPTPTKIKGWRGKWDILVQTARAAFGAYGPKP